MSEDNQVDIQQEPSPKKTGQIALRPLTIILFLTMVMLVLMVLGWPYFQARYDLPWDLPSYLQPPKSLDETATITQDTIAPFASPTVSATLPLLETDPGLWSQGLIVLSMDEGLDTHLFAYQPLMDLGSPALPLTRLTSGSCQDITPALSPDGEHLAFASNRSGYWNIYQLDLENGDVTQVNNSQDFTASPSWSPDGLWVAYEAHFEESMEIVIQPVDGSQDPIQLTNNIASDAQPAWGPDGRQIAFLSTRAGSSQVWLANLDESGEQRFINLSSHNEASATYPAWSPDGRYLAWGAVTADGLHNIYVWDSQDPDAVSREVGSGDIPAWSPNGEALLVVLNTPLQTYLTAYLLEDPGFVILPPIKLPGAVSGLSWVDIDLSGALLEVDILTPTPLWELSLQVDSAGIEGRYDLVTLEDVSAPYPRMHDRVDESFQALRDQLASRVGWDLLADLDNAFLPLSSALSPGLLGDWLYTGRAFAVNTLPINAGWMAVVREDFGPETYWRVYLRARFQDGTQGQPLYHLPWDFNARYSGQPGPYDQGGALAENVPGGYWVDMTRVAAAYGWQRLPALSTWRAAYPSARFNEFVKTDGLDWASSMLEIYPSEALLTLTPVPTATTSPTPAPLGYKSPTTTPTPSDTATPTPTETETPSPTESPSPTLTPSPTGESNSTETPTPTSTNTSTP